jgi:multicomponent Na+:H+ antiporter subunit F
VNPWGLAAAGLAVAALPGLLLTLRGTTEDRLVGLQSLNVVVPLALVAAAMAADRSVYLDVALVVALVSLAGGLAYARLLERWL